MLESRDAVDITPTRTPFSAAHEHGNLICRSFMFMSSMCMSHARRAHEIGQPTKTWSSPQWRGQSSLLIAARDVQAGLGLRALLW